MTGKRVFFLTRGRLTVYQWEGGKLVEPLAFNADETGLTRFALYLEQHPTAPVYVLVDVVEEEFRDETVPHVMGTDRRSVVAGRMNRLFRDATYAQAIFQGRESEGRKDDKVLFTALIRPDLLSPWLGQIARHKVPLAGIYSLPVFSIQLLKKLAFTSSHTLLVTLHRNGGLRQTFFYDQQIKVSRLAVMPEMQAGRYASYMLGEVEKVRRYLNSLRLLSRDSPLDVYVLCHGGILADLKRQATDNITTRYTFKDVAEAYADVGLKGLPATPYSDPLFAYLLAEKPPANHYARTEETRYFTLHRVRQGMLAASVLLLTVGILWGGLLFLDGLVSRSDTAALQQQIAFYEDRYRLARERLPPTPADGRDLRMAVGMADALRAYKTSPLPLMAVLSRGLDAFPSMQVEQVTWTAGGDPEGTIEFGKTGPRRDDRYAAPPPVSTGDYYQLAQVSGRVVPFDGDFRAALDEVQRFVDTLAEIDAVTQAEPLSLPLDTSSEQRLQGIAGADTEIGQATFKLRLVVKVKSGDAG